MSGRLWLVRVPPHVHQAHARMEPIEHDQRQRDVIEDVPDDVAVELVALVARVVRLHRERVEQPQRHIGDRQERDQLAAGLRASQVGGIRAAPQAVNYERRLDEDLDQLGDDDAHIQPGAVQHGRHHAEH